MKNSRPGSGRGAPLLVAVVLLAGFLPFAAFARVFDCPACTWGTGYIWSEEVRVTHTGSCRRCDGHLEGKVTLFNRWFKPREPHYR